MSEISVVVNGSTTINPTVGNGDTVNVTIASSGERGPTGSTGAAGAANTLSIGTVTSGTAAATLTGTAPSQVLNLVLQKGDAGTNIELQTSSTHIQWRLVGAPTWTNLVALTTITGATGSTGAAGAAVELQASGTHIQWRYVGGSTWTNVVALSSLVGATGATGATGPQGPAGSVNLADETPQPLGTASAGTALSAARADHIHSQGSIAYSGLSGIPSTFAPSAHSHAVSDVTGLQTQLDGKQAAGTYATLVGGTVPSSQLPSYVDDVIEYSAFSAFPATNDGGKIFVARDTGKIYRWSGSGYIEISPSPGSTDSVTEGSTNVYFTNTRAAAAAPVQSVAGRTGTVTLAKADVGLGSVPNVDATARANHTGTQTASTISDFVTEAAKYGPVASVAGRTGTITISSSDVGGLASIATSGSASDLASGTVPAARLPVATDTTAGAVKVGTGLAISSGVLSATGGGSYSLPTATSSVLGGIKVGANLTITDGVLAATGGGGGSGLSWSSVPASATATGTAGSIAYDNANGFFYVATDANTWKRAALSAWNNDPYWSSVSLLLSMEGSDSTVVDASSSPKTITAYYGAATSATRAKFGSKSLYLNGTTFGSAPYLSVPYSSAFNLATGDWTVECWAYATALNENNNLFAITSTGSAYAQIRVVPQTGGAAFFLTQGTSGDWLDTTSAEAGTFQTNTWQHVAAVRAGNLFRLYVNGTSVISYTSSSNLNSGSGLTTIGASVGSSSPTTGNSTVGSQTWQGHIDDFRLTKGVARYSGSSFTVPTAAFAS